MINRLIDYAQADPPAFFILADGASAEDLDAALRIISSLPTVGAGVPDGPPSSLSPK